MDQPMPQPQGAPPAQGSPDPSQQGQGPGKASQLVASIHDGLMQLMDMVNKAGIKPAEAALAKLIQGFESLVENELGSGGEQEQPGAPDESQQPPGSASPEAGGNPNARPMP